MLDPNAYTFLGYETISYDISSPSFNFQYIQIQPLIQYNSSLIPACYKWPLELKPLQIKQIDQLIEYGIFQSRNEAIKELTRLGAENLTVLSEVYEALEKLFELEKAEGKIPIDLSGATKQLLKERER
jgi:Arc/MetJ-type ribon-helix-helix transcriptional regulator